MDAAPSLHFCIFADGALDITVYDAKSAERHGRDLRKYGHDVKTVILRGSNADDAADFIGDEIFGAFKSLTKKIKADISSKFNVEFV